MYNIELATFIQQKGDKNMKWWSHFLDTSDDVVYQDILALDLTCLGGYLGGAESKPGVGELPI